MSARSLRAVLPTAFAALVLYGPSAKGECLAVTEPDVTVDIQAEPVSTVFDTSLGELEVLATAAGKRSRMPLMAAYSAAVLYTVDIPTQAGSTRSGTFCATSKSVRVRIVIGQRTIHAARELQGRPCLLATAIGRAEAHARNQEKSLGVMEAGIIKNIKDRVRDAAYLRSPSAQEAERQLTSSIAAQIDQDLQKAEAEEKEANRRPDTPDSLHALQASCALDRSILFGGGT